jgi:hypothetical protein
MTEIKEELLEKINGGNKKETDELILFYLETHPDAKYAPDVEELSQWIRSNFPEMEKFHITTADYPNYCIIDNEIYINRQMLDYIRSHYNK